MWLPALKCQQQNRLAHIIYCFGVKVVVIGSCASLINFCNILTVLTPCSQIFPP